MIGSLEQDILTRIRKKPIETLFIHADFSDLGSYDAVRKALSRLADNKQLVRVYPGIFQQVHYNKLLQRSIPPRPEVIAETIARKNNWRIVPAKDLALNTLGLDTQIPNSLNYVSNGPTKSIDLANGQSLNFRHVTQRESNLAPTSALVIEALKYLGQSQADEAIMRQILKKLDQAQIQTLVADSVHARVWIKRLITRTVTKMTEG